MRVSSVNGANEAADETSACEHAELPELCSLVLATAGWAGACAAREVLWSVSRCEADVPRVHDYGLRTAEGYHFHVRQTICVGTCRHGWTRRRASGLLTTIPGS